MLAILSDIHGNLEALQAVLRDATVMHADTVVCLGDVIGYGPDSLSCLEMSMDWPIVIRGNFEDALLRDATKLNWPPHLTQMIRRLAEQIDKHPEGHKFREHLTQLPTEFKNDDVVYVHGSPRDPVDEYVFPEHIYDQREMADIFQHFDRLCFCGHTHVAGVFTSSGDTEWEFTTPVQCEHTFAVGTGQVLCNVGSVGQPRDDDPRACYVLFDGETITFRRIDYDMETTIAKIRSGDDDDLHGDRLRSGR